MPKIGAIAGCMVTDGRITRAGETQARLLRDNVVVHEGKIGSLRRFKDDVSEVKSGFECGIGLERYNDIKVGDVIEVFTMERVGSHGVDDVAQGSPSGSRRRSDPPGAERAAHPRRRARPRHRLHHADARPGLARPAAGARLLHDARRSEGPASRPQKALERATPFFRRQIGGRAAAAAGARARVPLRRVDRSTRTASSRSSATCTRRKRARAPPR